MGGAQTGQVVKSYASGFVQKYGHRYEAVGKVEDLMHNDNAMKQPVNVASDPFLASMALVSTCVLLQPSQP